MTPSTTLKYFEEAGFLFCYATLEEICFRFTLIILLARVVLAVSGDANCRLRSTAFWTANVVQTLVFTWIHFIVWKLNWAPWYIEIWLESQTLVGLTLGYIFWKWGLETSIFAHFFLNQIFYFRAWGLLRLPYIS